MDQQLLKGTVFREGYLRKGEEVREKETMTDWRRMKGKTLSILCFTGPDYVHILSHFSFYDFTRIWPLLTSAL